MLKTFQSITITPAVAVLDWHHKNAYGNTYVNCNFVGTFVGFNFTRASFQPTCDFTAAVFEECNFTDVNPLLSDGFHPVDFAESVDELSNSSLTLYVNPLVSKRPASSPIPLATQTLTGTQDGGQPQQGGGLRSFFP